MKAKPGGSIHPFCDAVATTSRPHASVSIGIEQTLLIPSTNTSLSYSPFIISAAIFMLFVTPVEVSLCVIMTAFTSGFASMQVLNLVISTSVPKGNSKVVMSTP